MNKTINLETEDSGLFSKSAPLMAAAAECCYLIVRCSALNAEELRREHGMEALETAFERCVSVLSVSSKGDDVAVEVCTHIVRCYSVSAHAACRDRLIEMPELVKNICRLMYYKHPLSSVTRSLWSILAIPHLKVFPRGLVSEACLPS